jgi:Uma2 family endonuclease
MTLVEPRTARWTREQYYDMAALGWFKGKRAVLLDGEIIEMAGQGNWYAATLGNADELLRGVFTQRVWVRVQMPLETPGQSDPEPDLAVVPGKPYDYTRHPTTALLVVEVSDTSLRLDRRKANAYAAAGVPDYWILNLPDYVLEVRRDPVPDAVEEFGHRYGATVTLRPGDFVTPLAVPQARLAVNDLLPPGPVGQSF